MSYFKSKDVKVFPSAFRGQYDNDLQFDPEAISQSEYNIVHSGGGITNNKNYIISYDNNKLICVIGGYYFEISNISDYDINNKYLSIKLKEYSLTDINNNYDPGRVTYTLASWDDSTDLDDTTKTPAEFTGIKIDDNYTGASDYLQAFKDNNINYNEFLPQIKSGSGINSEAGKQVPNAIRFGADNNEASGESSVAFGEKTNALGKNSIAEGKNTVASGDSAHASGFGTDNQGYEITGINDLTLTLNNTRNLKVGSYLVSKDENEINKDYAFITNINGNDITLNKIPDGANTNTTIYLVSNAAVGDATFTNGNSNTAFGNYSHAEGAGTVASGEGAHTEGNLTEASGGYSHAEGSNTIASASKAHAEGDGTVASGTAAHAEGKMTEASGLHSHAEGEGCKANNKAAHAEGQLAQALADYSHAEGIETKVDTNGAGAHAEGYKTIAKGSYSHAEGESDDTNYINAEGQSSHSEGYKTKAKGKYSHAEGIKTTATGEGAHAEGESCNANNRAAHAEGYQTDAASDYAHAEGNNTDAEGSASHAEGQYTKALGIASHAEGGNDKVENPSEQNPQKYNIANGQYSHVEGINTTTTDVALGAHAEGVSTTASGEGTHAEGNLTEASGNFAHAEGEETVAEGVSSHAEGYKTTAYGYKSHAEGDNTTATGQGSHTEGYDTTVSASGKYAHAEGYQTIANGEHSHVEGYKTNALGKGSHAEGLNTIANGDYSHAEGNQTKTEGSYSKAAGTGTVANNENEVVIGKYNKYAQSDKRLFVVGDGIGENTEYSPNNRKNAFEIIKDETKVKQGGYELKLGEVSLNEIIRTSLLDFIYPVGSFYISEKQDESTINNVNKNGCPIAALGGQWVRVEGKMLYAAEVTGNKVDTAFTIDHEGGQKDAVLIKHNHEYTFGTDSAATTTKTLEGSINVAGFLNSAFTHTIFNGGSSNGLTITDTEAGDTKYDAIDDVTADWNKQKLHTLSIKATHAHTFNPNDLGLNIQDRGMGPVAVNQDNPNDIRIVNGNMPPYLCVYIWKRIK